MSVRGRPGSGSAINHLQNVCRSKTEVISRMSDISSSSSSSNSNTSSSSILIPTDGICQECNLSSNITFSSLTTTSSSLISAFPPWTNPNTLVLWCILFAFFLMLLVSAYIVLKVMFYARWNKSPMRVRKDSKVKVMIYFGSGGHTMELLRLLAKFDTSKYGDPTYVLSHSDSTSEGKIKASNLKISINASWKTIYRAREVKQSLFTTVHSSFYSLIEAFKLVRVERPQLIICNGPGTCVPICLAARFFNVLGLFQTKIVFAESFCRVVDLSLSGKLLYNTSDKFIVQWPQLQSKYKRSEYIGVIC